MAVKAMNTQPVPDPVPQTRKRGLGWLSVLLLLVLVGGLAAAGGWYLAKTDYDKKHAAMQKEIDGLKAEMDEEATTLEIKEWGVKMTADAEISDAKYVIEVYTSGPEDPGGGDGTTGGHGAYFTTTALVAADSMCDAKGSSPLGGIFRTSTSPKAEMGAIRVGSYYYYYQNGHQSVCSGKAEAEEGARLLEEAFETLTAS